MAVGEVTLGSIKLQARERTDTVNSIFFEEDELNRYVTNSYKELYDILIQKFGQSYDVAAPHQFTADGTSDTYTLPEDFYKLLAVDASVNVNDPNSWFSVRKFMLAERNRYVFGNVPNTVGRYNIMYRLRGNTIWFTPLPSTGSIFRLIYIPRPNDLTNDSDIIDGISGWEEYIITDVCIKMMAKEESDPTVFILQKKDLLLRIDQAAENRDAGSPERVQDVSASWEIYGGLYNGFDGL